MKKQELCLLLCPECKTHYPQSQESNWKCPQCGVEIASHQGIPLFTPVSGEIRPFEKRDRTAEVNTPWRNANWSFLHEQAALLDKNALILDVGAGRGDFADIFRNFPYLAVDVYPYPEVDFVCDLTKKNPLPENSCDAIALMNVLEHVYNPQELLAALGRLLKPGGELWIAIPFLLKIHQSPFDFFRYTHHALRHMAEEEGLTVLSLDGYYDPIFLIGESMRNVKYCELPRMSRLKRWMAKPLLWGMQIMTSALQGLTGKGRISSIGEGAAPAPIGYHLVLRKQP